VQKRVEIVEREGRGRHNRAAIKYHNRNAFQEQETGKLWEGAEPQARMRQGEVTQALMNGDMWGKEKEVPQCSVRLCASCLLLLALSARFSIL